MHRATGKSIPDTIKWEVNETKEVSDAIKLTTDRLLLAALVVSHVYSVCLTKAQMEVTYQPYSEAFEELKAHQISKRLKTIRRRAASSAELRREAMVLLQEEERCYWQKEDKWQKEQSKWTDRGMNMGLTTWKLQQKAIDRALGTSNLESLLPAITIATKDLIRTHLDFIPDIRQLENQLAMHEEEAEEISENLYKELSKIREVLGAQATMIDTKIPEVTHSTPKGKRVTFTPKEEDSLLLHDITSLEGALKRLRAQFEKASRACDDQSMEMLKATLETTKAKKGSMNLSSGSGDEIKEAYTLLDEVDVDITNVTAYINLEDRKERKKKEDEKTKGIMAAKSLPNTRIPPFTGKLEDFWEWLPQFQAACPATLPPEIRTGHLRQAIKDPATLDVISGCKSCEEMEDELLRHFGSKEEELNRLISQLDTLPYPRNKVEELFNSEGLRRIRRKLKAIGEERVVDKIRLGKVACGSFLPKTREELMEKLHERKGELILDYSLNQGIDPYQAKTLSLREGTPDLEVPSEEWF